MAEDKPTTEQQIRDLLENNEATGGTEGIYGAWKDVQDKGIKAGLAEVGVVIHRVEEDDSTKTPKK